MTKGDVKRSVTVTVAGTTPIAAAPDTSPAPNASRPIPRLDGKLDFSGVYGFGGRGAGGADPAPPASPYANLTTTATTSRCSARPARHLQAKADAVDAAVVLHNRGSSNKGDSQRTRV